MKTIIKGASKSLYWVEANPGAFRCMIASYMTNNDYIFSWQFPFPNYVAEPFYCADLIAAMNTIRNSGGFLTERVYHVHMGATPADDLYQDRYFIVAGRPLSSYPIQYARCNFTQGDKISVKIPQLAAPLSFNAIPNNYPYQNTNVIQIYANTGRTRSNALCQFLPNTYWGTSLIQET